MGDVIDFKNKEDTTDPIAFFELMIEGIKQGKVAGITTGVLILYHSDDSLGTFGFGPKNSDFEMLPVIECGKHVLMQDICGS